MVRLTGDPAYQNIVAVPEPGETGGASTDLELAVTGDRTLVLRVSYQLGAGTIGRSVRFINDPAESYGYLMPLNPLPPDPNQPTAFDTGAYLAHHLVTHNPAGSGLMASYFEDAGTGQVIRDGAWSDGEAHSLGFFLFYDPKTVVLGYVTMRVDNLDTNPALSVLGYAYESAGVPITVISIPEQGAFAAPLIAVAGSVLRRRRPQPRPAWQRIESRSGSVPAGGTPATGIRPVSPRAGA